MGRIKVAGADAETFLQGQLTQDLRSVQQDARWAGYCSPKGRLLALMQVRRADEAFELEMHAGVLEGTLKRLKMFVLRSKVSLDLLPTPPGDEAAWRRQNILEGRPVIHPQTSDHFVPQMVNLDQLGGIGLNKGCYTGQEIVARLHYLGQLKRRMFLLRGAGAPPLPGAAIYAGAESQSVGEVVDSITAEDGSSCVISAVLQLTQAESAELRLGPESGGAALSVPAAYHYASV